MRKTFIWNVVTFFCVRTFAVGVWRYSVLQVRILRLNMCRILSVTSQYVFITRYCTHHNNDYEHRWSFDLTMTTYTSHPWAGYHISIYILINILLNNSVITGSSCDVLTKFHENQVFVAQVEWRKSYNNQLYVMSIITLINIVANNAESRINCFLWNTVHGLQPSSSWLSGICQWHSWTKFVSIMVIFCDRDERQSAKRPRHLSPFTLILIEGNKNTSSFLKKKLRWHWSMKCFHMDDNIPDSKVHGANMGSIWGRQDPGGPHVGPMSFAIWGVILYNQQHGL